MTAPTTYAHFLEELDAAGFVSVWSPGGGDHARALWSRWFGPSLPAGQTLTLDELTQKPVQPAEFVLDMIADAKAYDESRGITAPSQLALDEYHDIGAEAACPITFRSLP